MKLFNSKKLSRIESEIDLPLSKRLPVLGVFSASIKHNLISIAVVTSAQIELFSASSGTRIASYLLPCHFSITCTDFFLNSSLGSCIFTGCSDGIIRIISIENLKLQSTIDSEAGSNLNKQITSILCPLNNTIVCGFSDGSLKSFFTENKQLAGTFSYPFEYTLDAFSLPVSCLSFCKSKKYVIAGYFKRIQPEHPVKNIPIVVYSLNKSSYIRHYSGARDSILSVELLEDQKYMIAASGKQILVWRYESLELFYTYTFSMNIPNLFPQAHCIASLIIPNHGFIITSFDSGLLVCLFLLLPNDTQAWSNNEEKLYMAGKLNLDNTSNITCAPSKLLQISSSDSNGTRWVDSCPRFLRYEEFSATLLSGDYLGRVNLIHDIFKNKI